MRIREQVLTMSSKELLHKMCRDYEKELLKDENKAEFARENVFKCTTKNYNFNLIFDDHSTNAERRA